ncbi:MAG: histidinol phosphate phosphatase domain-containing protein [Chloroflexi bacterium]|nr:histidinol phosphate phosphatase domain-containing protein [Chloroflexota bacterium]
MVYDFHTHSFLSDGELSPIELIRRAMVRGYRAIAVTDHASPANLEQVVRGVTADCELARKNWGFLAIPGVELTHVPAPTIGELARTAKQLGAWLVVVHGETIVEPVEKGTNSAALRSEHVDILAHPGLLLAEDISMAVANGHFIEISARKGHSLTNGHIVSSTRRRGIKLLLNSDAHNSDDLLTGPLATAIARGAGLGKTSINQVLEVNPRLLLQKLDAAFPDQHLGNWLR